MQSRDGSVPAPTRLLTYRVLTKDQIKDIYSVIWRKSTSTTQTHLPWMLLRQHSTRWQNAPRLSQMRRISRYQKSTLIVYTHSRLREYAIVLKEVISRIEIPREEIRWDVWALPAMPMSWRLFALLLAAAALLLRTFLAHNINFRIFRFAVAGHQLEIHFSRLWLSKSQMTGVERRRETQELFTLSHPSTDTRRLGSGLGPLN